MTHEEWFEVGSQSDAPRRARNELNRRLAGFGYDRDIDAIALLVSELVTNAVLHASSTVKVLVRILPGQLRVDVLDDSPELPQARSAEEARTGEGGYGLRVLDRLATSWGVDQHGHHGKSVWFTVADPN